MLLDDAAFLGCIDDTKYAEEHGRFGVQTPAVKVLQTGTVRGRGLFAETNIPAGTIVTEVAGERVTVKKMGEKRREQDPRIFYSVKGVEKRRVFHVLGIMDPEDGLGMGTFANDYRGAGGTGVNAEYVTGTDFKVYVKATRDLSMGEEILMDYGDKYWRVHPMMHNDGL